MKIIADSPSRKHSLLIVPLPPRTFLLYAYKTFLEKKRKTGDSVYVMLKSAIWRFFLRTIHWSSNCWSIKSTLVVLTKTYKVSRFQVSRFTHIFSSFTYLAWKVSRFLVSQFYVFLSKLTYLLSPSVSKKSVSPLEEKRVKVLWFFIRYPSYS